MKTHRKVLTEGKSSITEDKRRRALTRGSPTPRLDGRLEADFLLPSEGKEKEKEKKTDYSKDRKNFRNSQRK